MSKQYLDGKFHGLIFKHKDGTLVPPDQCVTFLAKDNAFALMVQDYPNWCRRVKAGNEQVHSAQLLVDRITKWRDENPHLCKVPDVQPGEIVL